MISFSEGASLGRFELDHQTHTVRFRRVVAATAQAVFNAWTRPEEVAVWWDPEGHRLARCEIDLRVGGHFTFVNAGHAAHPFSGTYTEIFPPHGLAFDAFGASGRVTLKEVAGRTEILVEIACRSSEHLNEFVRMGVVSGTAQTVDNLVAFVQDHFEGALRSTALS